MQQYEVRQGNRVVIITKDCGKFAARLYVNSGETATLTHWRGKTQRGAERWAQQVLSR